MSSYILIRRNSVPKVLKLFGMFENNREGVFFFFVAERMVASQGLSSMDLASWFVNWLTHIELVRDNYIRKAEQH
jgi:hypothetical protein